MQLCEQIVSIIEEKKTTNIVVIGDFNAAINVPLEVGLIAMCDTTALIIAALSLYQTCASLGILFILIALQVTHALSSKNSMISWQIWQPCEEKDIVSYFKLNLQQLPRLVKISWRRLTQNNMSPS